MGYTKDMMGNITIDSDDGSLFTKDMMGNITCQWPNGARVTIDMMGDITSKGNIDTKNKSLEIANSHGLSRQVNNVVRNNNGSFLSNIKGNDISISNVNIGNSSFSNDSETAVQSFSNNATTKPVDPKIRIYRQMSLLAIILLMIIGVVAKVPWISFISVVPWFIFFGTFSFAGGKSGQGVDVSKPLTAMERIKIASEKLHKPELLKQAKVECKRLESSTTSEFRDKQMLAIAEKLEELVELNTARDESEVFSGSSLLEDLNSDVEANRELLKISNPEALEEIDKKLKKN